MGEVAPKVTERASPARKSRCAAMGRLFVRAILSLCLGFVVSGLALSVGLAPASSPKGGALGRPGHFLLDARGPIWRKRAGLATEGRGQQDASGSEADAGSRNPGSFLSYPYCIRFHPETQGHLP